MAPMTRAFVESLELLLGRRSSPGAVAYDLRRLRLHSLIRRIPHTHRYEVTPRGLRYALSSHAVTIGCSF